MEHGEFDDGGHHDSDDEAKSDGSEEREEPGEFVSENENDWEMPQVDRVRVLSDLFDLARTNGLVVDDPDDDASEAARDRGESDAVEDCGVCD